jgi:ferritin-like metal-binding protein YciE
MIKLKNILTEAYAWERQAGKALPTLAEVQAAYDAKMREDVDPEEEVDDDGYPSSNGRRKT